MSIILTKNSGPYERTRCGPSVQSDFSKRLVSWAHWSLSHDIRTLKAICNSSKHCVQAIEMELLCKGQKEKLWREFFSDPSQWWDHREEKLNPRYPDFKHKTRKEALWLKDKFKPGWVDGELAAMAPGTVQPSLYTLNVRLARYVKLKQGEKTLHLFQQMQQEGISADGSTFTAVVNACASLRALEEGRQVHKQVVQNGFESDIYVASSLVNMYAKCGKIADAMTVFSKMVTRNVVSWNAMILGYVRCGQGQKALELSQQMRKEGVEPDRVTFLGLLNACASLRALEEGMDVHSQIIEFGFESDVFIASSLVDMYAKCGNIEEAGRVFEKMGIRDVVSWNAMIMGHVKCGQGQKALELYKQMQQGGMEPDPVTLVGLLNACASLAALDVGRSVHLQVIERGYGANIFISNSLIHMYAKCNCLEDAWEVFNRMPTRDVVSWNAMILGFVKCGHGEMALKLSKQMQHEQVPPNCITFVGMLNACARVEALEEGRDVHSQLIGSVCESDIFVCSSLIDMYAKCESMDDAQKVFDRMPKHNVVSWNAIILGYVKCGQALRALELSRKMQWAQVEPDPITLLGVLHACAIIVQADEKAEGLEDAWNVFNKIPSRNVVLWNTMILGYVKCGYWKKALGLYRQMLREGVTPDGGTFRGILNACGSGVLIEKGKDIHRQVTESGYESDVSVCYSLIEMYAACGSMEDAWRVFNQMPTPNLRCWNAMIHGHMKCGQVQQALDLSLRMQQERKEADHSPILDHALV